MTSEAGLFIFVLTVASLCGGNSTAPIDGIAAGHPDAVAAYLAWRGGRQFEALRSISEFGHVVDSGLEGSFEHRLTSDGKSWLREDLGVVKSTEAVDLRSGWRTNLSGQIESFSPEEQMAKRRQAALLFAGVFHGAMGAKISSLPDEDRAGEQLQAFRIAFDGPDTYDFLIEPTKGVLDGIRITEDRRTRLVTFGGWHLVDGIQEPSSISVASSNKASDIAFSVSSTRVNEGIPKRLFVQPASLLHTDFAEGSDWSGWVDFTLFDGRRIYVPALVNGRPTQMLLDSGAEATVVDPSLAEQSKTGEIGVEGAGGSASASISPGMSIVLGKLSLSNLTAMVMDLSRISKDVGVPLRAILGHELFKAVVVDIDFAKHRIAFRNPLRFKAPAGARAVPLKPMRGNRVLQLSIENKPPIPVLFDLGNGSPLDLFPSYWQTEGLLTNRLQSKAISGGSGGKQEVAVATLSTVAFAGEVFRNVPTNFAPPAATTQNSGIIKGNIGLPLLSKFRLITDYEKDLLFLVPDKTSVSDSFRKDRTGLIVALEGDHFVVTFVAPNSPAAADGWAVSEQITSVDGKPVDPTEELANQTGWRYRPAGSVVALSLPGGKTRTLVLHDYY